MSMLFDADGRPTGDALPAERAKPSGVVSVTRSFSYKLSLKNPDGSPTYESCDFFASQRAECDPEDVIEVSRDLDQFCMDEVLESIREFKERRARKQSASARSAA